MNPLINLIVSQRWSNAKSVYNGFKTWFNTLDWIKEIGGEMANR